MNQALQNVSLTLNNSKVSVQNQDVLNVYLKQFHQRFLSKNCQMIPSYIDKYYGKVSNAVLDGGASSYMSGIENGEKDSDTIGRSNEDFTVKVFLGDVEVDQTAATGVYNVANTATDVVASTITVKCSVNVSEPLLGLPTAEMKENESNYLSINNL